MGQCTYKRNIVDPSRNHFCNGKAISITYFERMCVSLVIQNAKRMRPIISSSVTFQSQKSFSTLFLKRHDFLKKIMEYKMHMSRLYQLMHLF